MERILWNQKLKIMIAMSHNVKDFQRRILKKSMLTMDAKIQVKSKVMSRLEVIQFKITAVVTRKPVKSSDPCNPDPCGPLSKGQPSGGKGHPAGASGGRGNRCW